MVGAQPEAAPSFGEIETDSYLYGAASPVLDRLSERLADSRTAMLLANRDARIVGRWAGDNGVLRLMDRTGSAPGFALHEDSVGTNGLGSVIEERRPLYVVGHEHFAQQFVGYACFGVPIHHPVLRRIEGVLTLVCRADEASPLMLPFVRQVSDSIQDRMFERVTVRERILLDSFAQSVRRHRYPVIAVNEHTVIGSPSASRMLDASDHAVIWQRAAEAAQSRQTMESELELDSGTRVRARFVPIEYGDEVAGALVELQQISSEQAAGSLGDGRCRPRDLAELQRRLGQRLSGRSPAWVATLRKITAVVRSSEPVLICGPPGSGKTRVARAIHDVSGRAGRLVVLDASMVAIDGGSEWLKSARRAFQEADGLLIRHLDRLDAITGAALTALAEGQEPDSSSPRLLATTTLDRDIDPLTSPLIDRFGVHELVLPPLSDRVEDIPDLAQQILSELGHDDVELAPEAMQALVRATWPGNVRQLERVLRAVAGIRPLGVVTLPDLPADLLHSPHKPSGHLEEVERRAVARALANADGNKTLAAEELGISRSTLYRKLRSFGSDLDRTAF